MWARPGQGLSLVHQHAGNVKTLAWASLTEKIITLLEFQGPVKDHRHVVNTPRRAGTFLYRVSTPKGQWLTSVYVVDVQWVIVVHVRSSRQRLVNVCLLCPACALSQICRMYFLSILKNDGIQKPLQAIDFRDYTLH